MSQFKMFDEFFVDGSFMCVKMNVLLLFASGPDVFTISVDERAKHDQQFHGLSPSAGGFITGDTLILYHPVRMLGVKHEVGVFALSIHTATLFDCFFSILSPPLCFCQVIKLGTFSFNQGYHPQFWPRYGKLSSQRKAAQWLHF